MRETCSLPTAPLRARNRHPSVSHPPTSFVHPPTSFPRRRESARPRETTAFRLLSQSPRGARADTKLAVDGNRHNATEFSRVQRKLVPARARGVPNMVYDVGSFKDREGEASLLVIPAPCLRHSREGGNLRARARQRRSASFPIAACNKSRCQTRRRRKSTQCDRVLRTTTETRARARRPSSSVPHPPTSFPRRRESLRPP